MPVHLAGVNDCHEFLPRSWICQHVIGGVARRQLQHGSHIQEANAGELAADLRRLSATHIFRREVMLLDLLAFV